MPRAARNAIVPAAARLAPLQRRAVRRIGHVNVSYASGPLAYPDRSHGGVRPGQRVPDVEVSGDGGTTRLYETLRYGRHVLLMPGPGQDLPAGLGAWRDQMEVVQTADGLGKPGSIFLVRPDGYVAARGSVARPGRLLAYLRQLFGSADRDDQALASADAG